MRNGWVLAAALAGGLGLIRVSASAPNGALGITSALAEDSPFTQEPEVFEKALPKLPGPGPQDPFAAKDGEAVDPLEALRDEEIPNPPFLETLDGASSLKVRSAQGKVRELKEGQQLEFGDRLTAGNGTTVRLVYEQGAQVLLSDGASAAVHEMALAKDEKKAPMLDLLSGEARILVPPPSEEEKEEESREPASAPVASASLSPGASPVPTVLKRPSVKFLVRSRHASMGVRGTDFVVSHSAEKAEVHTFTGIVDMAPNTESLRNPAQTVRVTSGNFTDRFAGKALNKPRAFEPGAFMSRFRARHPRMEAVFKQAARDHQSGRVVGKFRQAREFRAEREAVRRGFKVRKGGGRPGGPGADGGGAGGGMNPGGRRGKGQRDGDSGPAQELGGKRDGQGPGGKGAPGVGPQGPRGKKVERMRERRRRRPGAPPGAAQ